MNILVTTLFYQNYNYGGILQAYALYHKLQEMGNNVTELNYLSTEANSLKKSISRIIRLGKAVIHPIDFIESRKKISMKSQASSHYHKRYPDDPLKKIFDEFISQEFVSTPLYHPDTLKDLPSFDCYITGGDQMWNPLWLDKNYFLEFAKCRKIAYSCSVGKDILTEKEKEKLIKLISGIDYISTREKATCDWLTASGFPCKLIADPVFLLKRQEWEDFCSSTDEKYEVKEPYIFAYLLGEDIERRIAIKAFAKKNGFKIVGIPHVWRRFNEADSRFADYSFIDVGPREFIKLLSNASFVMTDSFHGTAFSLIFNKPFYNFSRFANGDKQALNSRLISVLEEYGIQNRMVAVDQISELDATPLDFEDVNLITTLRREKAISFLTNALDR